MSYKLKKDQEKFEMVDGPHKGKVFEQGISYDEVPKEYKGRFDEVKPGPPPEKEKKKPAGKQESKEIAGGKDGGENK